MRKLQKKEKFVKVLGKGENPFVVVVGGEDNNIMNICSCIVMCIFLGLGANAAALGMGPRLG